MKKMILLMFLLTFMLFAADVKIPVQGFLTDANGIALNGEQTVKFSIYDLDEDGNALWSEEASVRVEEGEFSYMLGTTDFVDSAVLENASPLYLGIKINDEVLSPRIELGVESKAIFAYKADNASKLEGKTLTELKTEMKTELDNDKLTSILARLDALETAKATLETEVANLKIANTEKDAKIAALETSNTSLKGDIRLLQRRKTITTAERASIASNTSRVSNLETKTESMSVVTDNEQPTVRFTGVNVQIISGSGSTDGTINGKGNLIVGYNEIRLNSTDNNKTGSHNLIVGRWHNYSSYGGFVAGYKNTISGPYSSISGGVASTSSGYSSSVSGGSFSTASGDYSSVSGGRFNKASGDYSSVSGGYNHEVSGLLDWKAGNLFEDYQ